MRHAEETLIEKCLCKNNYVAQPAISVETKLKILCNKSAFVKTAFGIFKFVS